MNKKFTKLFQKNKIKYKQWIFITLVVIVMICVSIFAFNALDSTVRKSRINAIFDSLKLDQVKYTPNREEIFGEKKPYEYDSSRSLSSYKSYIRGATVSETLDELRAAIAKTDFKFYEEPYPGGTNYTYIYKSPKNEYLRISVSSKLRDDEFFNNYKMGQPVINATASSNSGPTNVIIKVNLDDNNE